MNQQLRLFALPKPLAERFGADFFQGLPKTPGVYRMFDSADRIIYIGQSKNLRQRLFSYKNANPDRISRKVRRLLSAIRRIDFEESPSPLRAQLRENELLRQYRPKFNSVNVYPAAYVFVGLQAVGDSICCRWTREPARTRADEILYGAFKGVAPRACAALARLLFGAIHQIDCPTKLPRPLLLRRPVREFLFPAQCLPVDQPDLLGQLDSFFSGKSSALLETLGAGQPAGTSLFHQSIVAGDLDLLSSFFRIGSRRNHEIQSKFGLSQPLIRQEELDDWIVRDRLILGPSLADLKTSPASLTPASRPDLRSRSDLLADSKSSSHSSASVTRA